MQTKFKTFTSPEFGSVRTAGTPDNPLFCVKDLGIALGLKSPFKTERLRPEDKTYIKVNRGAKGPIRMAFCTIRGMRDALLNSQKKSGDLIYQWLSCDVVPVLVARSVPTEKPIAAVTKKPGADTEIPLTENTSTADMELKFSAFFVSIRMLDNLCDYSVKMLDGVIEGDVLGHIDSLCSAVHQSKAAILDIVRDLILVKGVRVSSIPIGA